MLLKLCNELSADVHRESKKQDTKLLFISLPNINRFFKFFHCYTDWEICSKKMFTDPTTPVAVLPCKISVYKNCINQKHSNSRPGVRILKRL